MLRFGRPPQPLHAPLALRGAEAIADHRRKFPDEKLDLRGADLRGANLSRSDLGLAWFDETTRTQNALMIDTKTVPARTRQEVRA